MAWLILKDGTKKPVDYNKAATIYQLLQGKKELDRKDPDFKKKRDFLSQVKDVEFDKPKPSGPKPWDRYIRTV